MHDVLPIAIVALTGLMALFELFSKPKTEGTTKWRYIFLAVCVLAWIVVFLFERGIISAFFGGC